MIEDDENQSPEYYDLYDDLKERLCEENEEGEDRVCCSGDDIKVGWGGKESEKCIINIDNIYFFIRFPMDSKSNNPSQN